MTTPDTLASLPKKWRSRAGGMFGSIEYEISLKHADELEAALDALAERWEELADSAECCEKEAIRLNYPPEKIETHARAKHNLRLCVAELRGRGASEKP